jgi:hypothetical protein
LTDSLVELFIDLMRAINTRAERRVDREQIIEHQSPSRSIQSFSESSPSAIHAISLSEEATAALSSQVARRSQQTTGITALQVGGHPRGR